MPNIGEFDWFKKQNLVKSKFLVINLVRNFFKKGRSRELFLDTFLLIKCNKKSKHLNKNQLKLGFILMQLFKKYNFKVISIELNMRGQNFYLKILYRKENNLELER